MRNEPDPHTLSPTSITSVSVQQKSNVLFENYIRPRMEPRSARAERITAAREYPDGLATKCDTKEHATLRRLHEMLPSRARTLEHCRLGRTGGGG